MKHLVVLLALCIPAISFAAITSDGNYILDKKHAHVGFSVSHFGISNVIGRFSTFDGHFTFIANGASTAEFEIEASSVDTNQSQRDEHIRSEDFFDVESYPKITFSSTRFTYNQDGDPKTITGGLFLHGQNKEVTFEVTPMGSGEVRGNFHAGYKATTKINRSEFGIDYLPGVVGEEISITINLEIIKQ